MKITCLTQRQQQKKEIRKKQRMEGIKGQKKGKTARRVVLLLLMSALLLSCDQKDKSQIDILIGAAASLEHVMKELQETYREQKPEILINFSFAGSGSIEQQIREGAPIDVFLSAAQKQMDALGKDNLILEDTRVDLLENQIVLIVPTNSTLEISSFDEILNAPIIALGDPFSVPVGQYAQEIFEGIKIKEEVYAKATFGKDVTEVLAWVSSGNADAGVVYATDAALSSDVKIVAVAPELSHSKAIYPVAVVKGSKEEVEAKDFIDFLGSMEAKEIFEKYEFIVIEQ